MKAILIASCIAVGICLISTSWSVYSLLKQKTKHIKKEIIIFFISVTALLITVPFLINECYMVNDGYPTLWGANDILGFYGSALTFLGTITLGAVAIYQNQNANYITKKALQMDMEKTYPFLEFKCDKPLIQKSFFQEDVPETQYDVIISGERQTHKISLRYIEATKEETKIIQPIIIENVSNTTILGVEITMITSNSFLRSNTTEERIFAINNTMKLARPNVIFPRSSIEIFLILDINFEKMIESLFVPLTNFTLKLRVKTIANVYDQEVTLFFSGNELFPYTKVIYEYKSEEISAKQTKKST